MLSCYITDQTARHRENERPNVVVAPPKRIAAAPIAKCYKYRLLSKSLTDSLKPCVIRDLHAMQLYSLQISPLLEKRSRLTKEKLHKLAKTTSANDRIRWIFEQACIRPWNSLYSFRYLMDYVVLQRARRRNCTNLLLVLCNNKFQVIFIRLKGDLTWGRKSAESYLQANAWCRNPVMCYVGTTNRIHFETQYLASCLWSSSSALSHPHNVKETQLLNLFQIARLIASYAEYNPFFYL